MQVGTKPFQAFQYVSLSQFYQDYYEYNRSLDESFSFSKVAELCQLRSRTEARNLVKGIKKLTEANIISLLECFPVEKRELEYLLLLNDLEQACDTQHASEYLKKIMLIQQKENQSNSFREIEVATSILHMTLLSIFDLHDISQDPSDISKKLKSKYSKEQIEQAIKDLFDLDFIKKENGSWKNSQKFIQKYDYTRNIFLQNFHVECLDHAKDSIEKEDVSDRYLVGASFCINSKVFPRIVQKMNSFAENLMLLENVAGDNDTVVQFNQQLVKMTN